MLRNFIIIFVLLFSTSLAAHGARAATPEEARQFIDDVGNQVLDVVNGAGNEAQKKRKLQQIFRQNVDIDWMAKFVLGPAWSQASEAQRTAYLQAYRDYLLARYTTNFTEYAGSDYTITGTKNLSEGQFSVNMSVESPKADQVETQAGYRVRASENGQLKISDIIIEGVSLITTERSEFASVVSKEGMDGLIKMIQAKTATKTS